MSTNISSPRQGRPRRNSTDPLSRPITSDPSQLGARAVGAGCYQCGTSFDEQLSSVINKSSNIQKAAIREIVQIEPGLSEAVVTGQLIHKLLKYASRLSVKRREATIRKVLELDHTLDHGKVSNKLNQLAMNMLPTWGRADFWSREIDPILLVGAQNAKQEFEDVLTRIQSLYPAVLPSAIRQQHAQYRSSSRCQLTGMLARTDWPSEADRMLRVAVGLEVKAENEAIQRAAKRNPEVRIKAIERRMKIVQRRARTDVPRRHLSWSRDIDTKLLEASRTNSLAQLVKDLADEYGCSRKVVYWHCNRLGIPHAPRPVARPWTAADLRYLTYYASDRGVRGMAEALGRSPWAIVRKLQQFGLETAIGKESQDFYSLRDLRSGLHVRHSKIVGWIARGVLKGVFTEKELKKGCLQRVRAKDLLHFFQHHLEEIDVTKIDPDSRIRALVDDVLAGPP